MYSVSLSEALTQSVPCVVICSAWHVARILTPCCSRDRMYGYIEKAEWYSGQELISVSGEAFNG